MTAPTTATTAGDSIASDPLDSIDFSEAYTTEDSPIPAENVVGAEEPKAGTAEPTSVATEQPERPALPDGYKYDAMGRVRDAKTGHVVAKDKVAELLAATPEPAIEPAKPVPFQYRTRGETKAAEGFLQNADGSITVSAEKAGDLRAMFNARDVFGEQSEYVNGLKTELEAAKQQIERSRQGSTEAEARANALVDAYSKMLQEPDEAKAIEAFFQLRHQYPVLLAKAEANHFKTLAESGRPAGQPKAGPVAERESATAAQLPTRESAIEATTDRIEHLKLDHQFRDLSADDWKQFSERTARTPFAYLRPATAEEAKQYDVTAGQIVFDTDALVADVTQYASTQKLARETAAQQAKLAADNARKTTPSITAPPVAGGGGKPAKVAAGINSPEDWETFLSTRGNLLD